MSYDLCSSRHCNVCLLLSTEEPTRPAPVKNLQKCSGCHLVLYCCKEHQRADWPIHSDFCHAVKKILDTFKISHLYLLSGQQPTTRTQLECTTIQVKNLLRTLLQRELQYNEEELTSFPAHCAVCYKFQNLKHCQRCGGVSYCSVEHARQDADQHKLICYALQLYYCPYKVQLEESTIVCKLTERVEGLSLKDLIRSYERSTLQTVPKDPTVSLMDYQRFANAADFSCIATICFALEFADMGSYKSNKFRIYIVGASFEQKLWFRDTHTQFFFLQYPQINELELHFIGPEAQGEPESESSYEFKDVKRHIHYYTYTGLFQDFCQSMTVNPSMIVCFNCGFSENAHADEHTLKMEKRNDAIAADTWPEGLSQILQTFDLPIVFTSFTKMEADFDYAALSLAAKSDAVKIEIERIFQMQQNPYRDLRPLRNWTFDDGNEIFYRNGYVQAVRTSMVNTYDKDA